MKRFTAIDLSSLPVPDVVETLDYGTVKAAMIKDFRARAPEFSALLESDPAIKVLEVAAYRELLLRQRINEAACAVMLARARGRDLDHLAALYGVKRLETDPGDPLALPPRPPSHEDDDSLRGRTQMAFEGFSTAGPVGAYLYHAYSADGRVADVSVASPAPVEVVVTILGTEGDGTPPPDLLKRVEAVLSNDDVRPLTDHVTVQAGKRRDYEVCAELDLYDGPEADIVLRAAREATEKFVLRQRRLGEPVTIDGLHKALRAEGVRRVTLTSPLQSVETAVDEYPYCKNVRVEASQ